MTKSIFVIYYCRIGFYLLYILLVFLVRVYFKFALIVAIFI